ncbi:MULTISPECIES: ABC transporter ATP-binding protein [unclassified Streptomyces]|uniref:ABC transporter ATP-binding protein n=1 Tax=unclassified Streptomyces TaxID=2593676 RepID=UPI0006F82D38|nr:MULTISPECIES: ABC transporter ATP-binding protein [unclassified Streptomyces]KQX56152.1 spermidine/putrescine ABC transporter ATP-binding protein [Streptomyces sp. Root1304]KRA96968.1 spermidine/putrescine ABC transporter ATP-binding protein [Streptomyces sp. Root66D1]
MSSATAERVAPAVGTGARLEFRSLRRAFGSAVALDGLDLTVEPGELIALLGPSGCGKTTALRMVAGFERPDSGAVLVDGEDITDVPANRRDAGMVFQSYSLFPHMTVRDNVAFGMRIRKVPAARRKERAAELLDLVGLPQHGDRYPHQLSGGQQQRVALARALALEPRVLLLDEPLSALDAKVRLSLREEIRRLQLSLGVTTVFVTHDQEEALSMADRVAVLHAGRLEQCAAPAELYARPATAFVAEFVGTMNRLPGRLTGTGAVEVAGQTLPVDGGTPAGVPAGGEVEVLVRPENVTATPDAAGDATVVGTSFFGAVTRVRLTLPSGTEIKADLASREATALTVGARARVGLAPQPVLVVPRTAA